METQLFLWTGKIIWWAICCSAAACAVGGGILAPIIVRRKAITYLWTWAICAELARYGVSLEDMRWIRQIPDLSEPEGDAFEKVSKRLYERRQAREELNGR